MAQAGVPRDHIAKVLKHVEGDPAARRLQAIIDGKTSKVVAMRAR